MTRRVWSAATKTEDARRAPISFSFSRLFPPPAPPARRQKSVERASERERPRANVYFGRRAEQTREKGVLSALAPSLSYCSKAPRPSPYTHPLFLSLSLFFAFDKLRIHVRALLDEIQTLQPTPVSPPNIVTRSFGFKESPPLAYFCFQWRIKLTLFWSSRSKTLSPSLSLSLSRASTFEDCWFEKRENWRERSASLRATHGEEVQEALVPYSYFELDPHNARLPTNAATRFDERSESRRVVPDAADVGLLYFSLFFLFFPPFFSLPSVGRGAERNRLIDQGRASRSPSAEFRGEPRARQDLFSYHGRTQMRRWFTQATKRWH